jgi:hypothetical protein
VAARDVRSTAVHSNDNLVKVLLRKCEILNWQHSIVSPAINMS